jgi:hypothetical protein
MLKHKNEKIKNNHHDYSNEELKRLGIFKEIKNKIKKR